MLYIGCNPISRATFADPAAPGVINVLLSGLLVEFVDDLPE
jgi:hypothetical protein